jgi:membrane fusion protein, adhesin transport system
MVATPYSAYPLALLLMFFLVTVILSLFYVPWQQSVSGAGKLIIFSPMERPQNIEAQIPARIVKWYVQEGQIVTANQTIVDLADLDSKFLDVNQLQRLQNQKATLVTRLEAANLRAKALENQIQALTQSREAVIPAAVERVQQASDRLTAAQQALEATKQNLVTVELNKKRIEELNQKGLRSDRDRELVELDYVRAKTEVERAQAALEVARRDTSIGRFDQTRVENDTLAGLSSAQASLAATKETIASINNDIIKLEIDLQNLQRRVEQRTVKVPRDGRIVRVLKVGAGETVKSGDILAVIAPLTTDQAVELYVSDNDAPLVAVGRGVRLQFAGWPAIQFSGWPSIAVGTFAGKVSVIDPIDDGKSRYRLIITPDWEAINQKKDEPWPDTKYLRPGAEVTGFIMLDTVSLGFELWRQFNAFPPTVQREVSTDKAKAKGEKDKDDKDEK